MRNFSLVGGGNTLEMEAVAKKLQVVSGQAETPTRHPD